jgi:hypothetical protein
VTRRVLAILLGAASAWGGGTPAHADRRSLRDESAFAWADPQASQISIAVGDGPTTYHYVARREPSGVTVDLYAAMIDSQGYVDLYRAYAAGDGGVVLRRTKHGSWTREATPTTRRLRALLASSDFHGVDDPAASEIYAVGDAGTVLRRSAVGIWSVETVPTRVDLYDIVRAHRRLYAVGDRGTLLERRDGAWHAIPTHTEADLRRFDGRVAVGRGGVILDCAPWAGERFDPGPPVGCLPRPSPTDADLLAIEHTPASWRTYGAGGAVVRAVHREPLDVEIDPPLPGGATVTAVSAVKGSLTLPGSAGYAYVDPAIAVGRGGAIDFIGNERAHVVLAGAPDLFGVAVELFDAFAVGAGGAIVHLQAVELAVLYGSDGGYWPKPPVMLRIDAAYQRATDGTQLAAVQGTVHYDFRNNRYTGSSYSELTGSVGGVSGARTAYAITARIGSEGLAALWCSNGTCPEHLIGLSAGVALDRAGDRIPRAWTLPIDGYWYWPISSPLGSRMKLGAVGGVSWAFAGADRGLGWRAGLDLFVRNRFGGHTAFAPQHVHVGAGVQRLAGRTFLGLTVGIWGMDRYDVMPVLE